VLSGQCYPVLLNVYVCGFGFLWRFLVIQSGHTLFCFSFEREFPKHPKYKMSVREDEPPFLSVELEVRFGCRTKTSQSYHVSNTVAWSGEVVETFRGSFRLNFIDTRGKARFARLPLD